MVRKGKFNMYYLMEETTMCEWSNCNKKSWARLYFRSIDLGIGETPPELIGRYCKTHGKRELARYQNPPNVGPQILNPKF